ncbi:hypothetical protein AMATHDRAFT_45197 [Amanita thiersii Skay4041]|uniref:Pali-domain-containing protein n=1 Tax=Amanita thiersii Skay4041 TaxID=703135 RepID=A0A2A9NZY4_9AGAR|nr:hypothetical protein AMATHDRAFT_45197 [Amanita thiersii Skay4041]
MVAEQTIPGVILCFSATILLLLVCSTSPTTSITYFLDVLLPTGTHIHYGLYGSTGSKSRIGYRFDVPGFNLAESRLSSDAIFDLTKALVLHPIGAALAFIAFCFGLWGLCRHRMGTILMACLSSVAAFIIIIAWIIQITLFTIARTELRNQGFQAEYGYAIWITLVALVTLLIGFCAAVVGIFGRYKRKAYSEVRH